MGPKRIAALEKEAEEWRMKAEDAVASIQDITVTYFAQTSKALAGMSGCVYFFLLIGTQEMKFGRSFAATPPKQLISDVCYLIQSVQTKYTAKEI